jgi:hypothetical protein
MPNHTKPAIVIRAGQPPVVEHLACERVERYPGDGIVTAVRFEELQRLVGGMFDMTRPRPDLLIELEQKLGVKLATEGYAQRGFHIAMVVHDEGAIRGMPVNELGTQLYGTQNGWQICGDVVLVEVD